MGNYRPSISFTDYSNDRTMERAEYMKKIDEMARKRTKRYCAKHLTAYWGKSPLTGEYYERCSAGHRLNEKCEVGK